MAFNIVNIMFGQVIALGNKENEMYLEMMFNAFTKNMNIKAEIFTQFQNNLELLLKISHKIHFPLPLPFFHQQFMLPPQLKQLGMKDEIQSPSYLNLNI